MLNKRKHSSLWSYFTGVVFTIITLSFLFVATLQFLLSRLGVFTLTSRIHLIPICALLGCSMLIGAALTVHVGKLFIRPIQHISDAFDELSKGNFDVRVPTQEKVCEIREMSIKFNAMVYDLSHIETLRNDFVTNVSHEFKTPIASIEGYTTLLQNHSLSAEKHDYYVQKILDNSRKLTNLSSNILLLSKLENQETMMHKTKYRLDEQIRKAILLLEDKWTSKNIEFDMELPKVYYYSNEPLLEQVWSNILDNAIKHSADGGNIQISIQESEQEIAVSIADHGTGMSDEVKKHIFEKFYQGDSSHKMEGNGLGLSLVKRITELCGGNVLVGGAPGEGAIFTVCLPKQ